MVKGGVPGAGHNVTQAGGFTTTATGGGGGGQRASKKQKGGGGVGGGGGGQVWGEKFVAVLEEAEEVGGLRGIMYCSNERTTCEGDRRVCVTDASPHTHIFSLSLSHPHIQTHNTKQGLSFEAGDWVALPKSPEIPLLSPTEILTKPFAVTAVVEEVSRFVYVCVSVLCV